MLHCAGSLTVLFLRDHQLLHSHVLLHNVVSHAYLIPPTEAKSCAPLPLGGGFLILDGMVEEVDKLVLPAKGSGVQGRQRQQGDTPLPPQGYC